MAIRYASLWFRFNLGLAACLQCSHMSACVCMWCVCVCLCVCLMRDSLLPQTKPGKCLPWRRLWQILHTTAIFARAHRQISRSLSQNHEIFKKIKNQAADISELLLLLLLSVGCVAIVPLFIEWLFFYFCYFHVWWRGRGIFERVDWVNGTLKLINMTYEILQTLGTSWSSSSYNIISSTPTAPPANQTSM